MNVPKQIFLVSSLLFVVTCSSSSNVFGDFTDDLRTNNNVTFDFGDYQLGSTYFFTNEGLDIDISNPFFGEVAIASATIFDLATVTSVQVTARVGGLNDSDLILNVRNSSTSDVYVFEFSQSDFTVGEFVTVSLDADDFQLPFIDTGVLNGDIEFFGFTVPFSLNTSSLDYTVQTVTFVTSVPEPTTLSAMLFACGLLGTQRKRSLNLGT